MQKKIQKMFFDCDIIAFELVALNTSSYWENISVIGSHYANKESQDFRYSQKSVYGGDFLGEWSKIIPKTLSDRFKQFFGPLTCWLSISVLIRIFMSS